MSWGFGITIIPKAHGSPVGHPRLREYKGREGLWEVASGSCPKLSVLQPGSGWLLSAVVRSTQAEGWRKQGCVVTLAPVIVDLPPAQREQLCSVRISDNDLQGVLQGARKDK